MTKSRPVRSLTWLGVDRLCAVASVFFTNVLFVRSLGVEAFGEWSALLAAVTLLAPLSQMGLSAVVTRALLAGPAAQAGNILGTALRLRAFGALGGVVLGLLYWLSLSISQPAYSQSYFPLLLIGQSLLVMQVLEYFFQARERVIELVRYRIAAISIATVLKAVLLIAGYPIEIIAIAFFIENVLVALSYWIAFRQAYGESLSLRRDSFWSPWFVRRAGWLVLAAIAEAVYLRIDVIMLERMRGAQETGVYAIAARLSEVWYSVPVLMMAAWFPVMWAARSAGVNSWGRAMQRSFDGLVAFSMLIAIGTQVFAEPLVSAIFGPPSAESAVILQIHIWAGIFIFMKAVVARWIMAEDLPKFLLLANLVGAVSNVLLNLWWIPLYGAAGAAYATLASYALASWLMFYAPPRTRGVAVMMTWALLLPLRWTALMGYWHEWRRSR